MIVRVNVVLNRTVVVDSDSRLDNLCGSLLQGQGDCRGTQRQFSENICSEDDLRSRIFGTFFGKIIAFLPLLRFSNV